MRKSHENLPNKIKKYTSFANLSKSKVDYQQMLPKIELLDMTKINGEKCSIFDRLGRYNPCFD